MAKTLVGDILREMRTDCTYSVESLATMFYRDESFMRGFVELAEREGAVVKVPGGWRKARKPKPRQRIGQVDWVGL